MKALKDILGNQNYNEMSLILRSELNITITNNEEPTHIEFIANTRKILSINIMGRLVNVAKNIRREKYKW
jgi:hypothetical protein